MHDGLVITDPQNGKGELALEFENWETEGVGLTFNAFSKELTRDPY